MTINKNFKTDLKARWQKTIELSFIASLAFLILGFKFWPDFGKNNPIALKLDIPILALEDIPTIQEDRIPPPMPKPTILVTTDKPLDEPDFDPKLPDITDVPAIPPRIEENAKEEKGTEPVVFEVVETMPAPVGGLGGIQQKISYPEFAKRAGVQGTVFVKAYVDENGNVFKIELVKGIGAGCDEEAIKAVMDTRFSPGMQRMKPVKVMITIPIKFILH